MQISIGHMSQHGPPHILFQRRLNSSSENLKKYYNQTSQNLNSIRKDYRYKEKFYVDLQIVSKDSKDGSHNNQGRKNLKEVVTIDQLLHSRNKSMSILQGPGGVGKTSTLEAAVLHWSQGKIWTDVKFVFLFKFRELNLFEDLPFKSAVSKMYDGILKDLKFDDLDSYGEKIVFLMDGIDEFQTLNKTLDQPSYGNDTSIAAGLYKLIHSEYFPGRQVVMTGRSHACQKIRSKFNKLKIDTYKVLGFSLFKAKEYIKLYFEDNDITKANNLIARINKAHKLQVMATTPAFLWSLCEIQQNIEMFEEFDTLTPLWVLQLTLFFKEHLLNSTNSTIADENIMELFAKSEIQELLYELSSIAKETLETGTLLVDSKKFKISNITALERSGFVNVISTKKGNKVEFYHLLMQEFLVALHFLKSDFKDHAYEMEWIRTYDDLRFVPSYAGLRGGCVANSSSSRYVIDFVRNLNLCNGGENQTNVALFLSKANSWQRMSVRVYPEAFHEYQNNMTKEL
ncbi:NACHT, LRR and PYD domains-containing protein 9-like [Clytia hemisphaerica]|uniref:NACHT, LRR and PYD domains-containing protein 9-like n=1 Tax=Clytia hemisphaerica TaxID=252671 RepID=UPI0034D63387